MEDDNMVALELYAYAMVEQRRIVSLHEADPAELYGLVEDLEHDDGGLEL